MTKSKKPVKHLLETVKVTLALSEALNIALQLHQKGLMKEAEMLCRRIPDVTPKTRMPCTTMVGSDRGNWSQDNDAWNMLRHLPEAEYLGLVTSRLLLRLPYGKNTDPAELFDFEEMPIPVYDQYLWGNPAFACACLIGEAFSVSGWEFRPGMVQDIENLPLHVYKTEGESHVTPCTGTLLTEDAVEAIMDMGLMPLISFKAKDMVRLARFQSVADPSALLAGSWKMD